MKATALTLCLVATIAQAREVWQWSPDAPHHAAACVIQMQDGASGSGVYIQDGPAIGVLTAAHVLTGGNASVTFSDGTQQTGVPTVDKYQADVGFVFVTHPTIKPLKLSSVPPRPGDRVEILGFGGPVAMPTKTLRHFYGTVVSCDSHATYMQAPIMHGDSGAAILNTNAEVIGVQSFGDPQQIVARVGTDHSPVYGRCGAAPFAPIRAFLGRLHARFEANFVDPHKAAGGQCSPYGCSPQRNPGGAIPGPASVPPPNLPHYAQPEAPAPCPDPTPAPLTPVAPSVPQSQQIEIDYHQLAGILATEYADLIRGPKGEPGPAGPMGSRGLPGASPSLDVAAIAAEVRKTLPPLTVEFEGSDTEPGRIETVPVGGTLKIPPVKLEIRNNGEVAFEKKPLGKTIAIELAPK